MTRSAEAERLRRCREQFVIALALGVPMDAAGREAAQRRWAAADARLAARRCGSPIGADSAAGAPDPAPWMMRD